MDNNAGGWGAAEINYGGISPAEALNFGAQLKERSQEKKDMLAAQKERQQSDNRLKNYDYVHGIGNEWKALPERMQDVAHGQLQDIKDKYSDPKYLDLDPAMLHTLVDNEVKPLAAWYDKSYTEAQEFDKQHQQYVHDNPNVPQAESYEMGVNHFVGNHTTFDPQTGKLTYMPVQQISPEKTIDYLQDPNTIGQMNVPLDDLYKNAKDIPTDEVGGTHSVNDKGNLKSYSWRDKANGYMQPIIDPKTGMTMGHELQYKTIPGLIDPRTGQEARVPTDEYMQQLLRTKGGQNSYYKQRQLTKDFFKGNIDDEHLKILTDAAVYDAANKQSKTSAVITEKEATPKPTTNIYMGNNAPVYHLYDNLVHAAQYGRNDNKRTTDVAWLSEAPQAGVDVILPYAQKLWGKGSTTDEYGRTTTAPPISPNDIKIGYDSQGKVLRVINFKTGQSFDVDKTWIDRAVNSAKGDNSVYQDDNARQQTEHTQPATKPKETHTTETKNTSKKKIAGY